MGINYSCFYTVWLASAIIILVVSLAAFPSYSFDANDYGGGGSDSGWDSGGSWNSNDDWNSGNNWNFSGGIDSGNTWDSSNNWDSGSGSDSDDTLYGSRSYDSGGFDGFGSGFGNSGSNSGGSGGGYSDGSGSSGGEWQYDNEYTGDDWQYDGDNSGDAFISEVYAGPRSVFPGAGFGSVSIAGSLMIPIIFFIFVVVISQSISKINKKHNGDAGAGFGPGPGGTGRLHIGDAIVPNSGNTMKPSSGGTIKPSSAQGVNIRLPDRTAEIENIIKTRDPSFSAGEFIAFVKRMYVDIQIAWCKRDLSSVRALLHDNLYDATVKQIQSKIDQNAVYHYEDIRIGEAYLTSYTIDAQFEYLTVYLNASMIDWQEDERTGRILRGDKTTRWGLRYTMRFMRSVNVLPHDAATYVTGHVCPNCAAQLELASSAKCPYCGAAVTTGKFGWVLSDFGTVRNDSIDPGIKTK